MSASFSLLSLIVVLPLFGVFFALLAKDDENNIGRNVFNVSFFAVLANITLILRIFMLIDVKKRGLQLVERFNWLENPNIDIIFGVDVFSMMMILAIHLAFIIVFIGVRHNQKGQKAMMVFAMLFLSMVTGFFIAADVFSFYIFFEAMLLPLFMLTGMFGEVKKQGGIYRFFLYNFIGALFLFAAIMVLFHYQSGIYEISTVSKLKLVNNIEYFIWGGIFLSLLSRIPIWPFHYWISSINSGIKNPLVFLITGIIPLTGVYGFIRFLPTKMPMGIDFFILSVEIIGVITMLFIALIGFINKDRQYKVFSYMTVYYIMYLLGVISKTDLILINIGLSFFSYVIIVAALEVLSNHIHRQQEQYELSIDGMLCAMPRLAIVYSFLIFAAVGLPLSSMFLNNFLILSKLLNDNIKMGMVVALSLTLVGGTLLQELYKLRNRSMFCVSKAVVQDISKPVFIFMCFVMFVLVMSFVRPLWFVVG